MLAELIPKIAGMSQKQYDYRHRCSNATYGEKCFRQQVYHALKIPPNPFPDRVSLILDDSSWHEELTGDWIRKSNFKLHSVQMEVIPFQINGKDVKGRIDGMLTDTNSLDTHYEHKAINHFTFTAYEEGNLWPMDYICQCVLYQLGIEKITGKRPNSILLIKNKNTSRYIEYHIEYDDQVDVAKIKLYSVSYDDNELGSLSEVKEFFMDDIVAKIKQRFLDIDKYVADKRLPKRQFTIDDWHCQYCRWASTCWKNYEEEVSERGKEIKVGGKSKKLYTEYIQADTLAKEHMKTASELKDKVKQKMIEINAESVVVGDYVVRMTSKESSSINKKLIPEELLSQITTKKPYEAISYVKYKVTKGEFLIELAKDYEKSKSKEKKK